MKNMKRTKKADIIAKDKDFFIDQDLEDKLEARINRDDLKVMVVSAGITSSGLGDERNLREFLLASEITNYLRSKNTNVIFYLFDDSFDPLTFAQLRVGVKKDDKLIKKFEKYCGTPIKLIPDPYGCHASYSAHFQDEILKRFHSLGVFPCLIDMWSLYEKRILDPYKEIIFKKHLDIKSFLSKKFPGYTMKNLFWVFCHHCNKIDSTEIRKIENNKIRFYCKNCKKSYTKTWENIKGKFSWKIDTAIKWNLFKSDFEPYTYAYIDPTAGSYFIAKSISEKFFKGCYPECINIGKVNMDKELSYILLSSLPKEAVKTLFLKNRQKDITINTKKVISVAKECQISEGINFYDYVREKLPYDIIQGSSVSFKNDSFQEIASAGHEFAKNFLKIDAYPTLPDEDKIKILKRSILDQVTNLMNSVIEWRHKFPDDSHDKFLKRLNSYLKKNKVIRSELFPQIRDLFSLEHGIPLSRIFYSIPPFLLYEFNLRLVKRKFSESSFKEIV